jgi:four helix bundle protein
MKASASNEQVRTYNIQSPRDARSANDLEERLLNFSTEIIRLVDGLPNTRAGNHVAGQLLRSGTSPMPNHGEIQPTESHSDYVRKFQVCLKKLRESKRWLRLIIRVPMVPNPESVEPLLDETEHLIKIFFTTVQTISRRAAERSKAS